MADPVPPGNARRFNNLKSALATAEQIILVSAWALGALQANHKQKRHTYRDKDSQKIRI
jgi:hypothetical protein